MRKYVYMLVVIWAASSLEAASQILRSRAELPPVAKSINKAYDFDYFFPFKEDDTLHLTKEQKRKELDLRYASIKKEIKAVANDSIRQRYGKINDDAYLNFRLRLARDTTEEYRELISRINPNDSISLINYLPQRFINYHQEGDFDNDWGNDLTAYGLEYLRVMRQYITNPYVKHALLESCAHEVLSYGKNYSDIDLFWKPFIDYAAEDTMVINKYQFKVDAIKRTKSGTKAIDFTFDDTEGKKHHLSDIFGKYLYIDCWATWCGPCCKEIPFLEKQVEAMKNDKRISFISISLDKNRNAWLQKLKKGNPSWSQYIVDTEGLSVLSRQWGVTGIPRFIIISPDGKIVDADAFRPSDHDFIEKMTQIIAQ